MSKASWVAAAVGAGVSFAFAALAMQPARVAEPLATISLLRRMTLSLSPVELDQVHLRAREVWSGQAPAPDIETDEVFFYHSVPIEIQQTEDAEPLSISAARHQQKLAAEVEKQVDRADAAGATVADANAGRLLNLNGEVWTLAHFIAQFVWTVRPVPGLDGQPCLDLHFEPAPGLHPGSRIQRVLGESSGDLDVDPATGQVLGGTFHSLAPVKFGGGLLAKLSFQGSFAMQPVPGVQPGQSAPWVLKQIVLSAQGRELFHHVNGTETMTYTVESH